jgi:hypothetical protein
MANRDGHWSCAELTRDHSLGYGTYIFSIDDSTHLKPSAVMGNDPLLHLAARQLELRKCQGPSADAGRTIAQHTLHLRHLHRANEKIHIDLYDFHHEDTPDPQPEEVVIRKFVFIPGFASR